jgi:hypothetical protein
MAALPGKRRVSARRGWTGEKAGFLSILRERSPIAPHAQIFKILAP